ncbi:hypothetical protein ES703_100497 [subsurface metagenome]
MSNYLSRTREKKDKKKPAKAVRILKAAFNRLKGAVKWSIPRIKTAYKWSSENLTMGKVIKWGMILLVVVAAISGYFFG